MPTWLCRHSLPVFLVLPTALFCVSCTDAEPEHRTREPLVVAGVGVGDGELLSELERQPRAASNAESRAAFLDDVVRTEVLVHRAREAGFHRDPELVRAWKRLLASRFAEEELAQRLSAVRVTNLDVAREYEANRDDFRTPEAVRLAVIRLAKKNGSSGEALLMRARTVRQEVVSALADGPDAARNKFSALARRHSHDRPSRHIGGDQGWVNAATPSFRWGDAVRDAALAIESPGGVAPVVETDSGIFVVQLIERRAAELRPLARVREDIRRRLREERVAQIEAEFDAEMRRDVEVVVDRERIEELFDEIADSAGRVPPVALHSTTGHSTTGQQTQEQGSTP